MRLSIEETKKGRMQIIKGLKDKFDFPNPVVTIGNFDGIHIGHHKILSKVIQVSKQIGGTPVAISFEPHPVRVLAPERGLRMLTAPDDKVAILSKAGLSALIIIPFDKEFSLTEPDTFIKDILIEKFGIKWLIVGHSFSFGKRKKGNTNLLRQRARKYGFGFSVVRYAKVKGNIVSSSRVRSLIQRGRVSEASEMLGRAYHVKGNVIKGTGRGTAILNIPTANIYTVNEILPKEGVYAVRVSISGLGHSYDALSEGQNPAQIITCKNIYDGAANIGKNPTFGDIENVSLEVHILDFDKNLLGREVAVHFIERIRDEKRFSGVIDLRRHIIEDIGKAKKILLRKKPALFLPEPIGL